MLLVILQPQAFLITDMQNHQNYSTAPVKASGAERSSLLSVLSNFSSLSTPQAFHPSNQVYYVDDCNEDGGTINVDYTLNDNWQTASILKTDLRRFVLTEGLNDYCFDHCANGEHVQDAGSFDLDTFLSENLNSVVAAYLRSRKAGQNAN